MGCSNSKKLEDDELILIKNEKEDLISQLELIKKESILLSKKFLTNDNEIFKIGNRKIDELDNLIDIYNKPNKPNKKSKNILLNLENIKKDKLDEDIFNQLKEYKKTLEDSSKIFEDLILTCGKKIKEFKTSFEDIKNEITHVNQKYKEVLKILIQPFSYIIEEFDIKKFKNKKFKDYDMLKECRKLIDQLQKDFKYYVSLLKGFNNDIIHYNNTFLEMDDHLYNLIKNEIFEKIKEIITLLNEGIILIEEKSKRINTFNNDIKTKKISNKEYQKFVDIIKDEVL